MKIEYMYDNEVVMTFECGTTSAIEKLIAAFNAGDIDDMGFLKLVEE